jgi:hypothetical protein
MECPYCQSATRPGYSEAATKGKLTRSFGFLQVRFRPLTPGARENYFAFPADELKGAGVRRGFGSFPLPEGRFCCAFTPFCDIGTAIPAISDLYFAPGDTLAISGPRCSLFRAELIFELPSPQ